MRIKKLRFVAVCSMLFLCAIWSSATIHYVKPDDTGGAWSGKTPVYTDLQAALAASVSGDEIWVAHGTYKPTTGADRKISFELKDGVKLYGGFSGTETSIEERNWRDYKTILSGNIGDENDDSDNSYHVLTSLNATSLDNLLDGFIIEKGCAKMYINNFKRGGGIYLENSNLVIVNSVFQYNYASDDGGAIYINKGSLNCYNSLFVDNTSEDFGGAIYNYSAFSSFVSCVIYNNKSNYWGGGLYASGSEMYLTNSIVYGNKAEVNYQNINRGTVSYSIIEGGYSGEGVISNNPNFINPNQGDFRLTSNSPAINAGKNDSIPEGITLDFYGNNRILEDIADIGIFEGGVIVPVNTLPTNKEIISGSTTGNSITFKANWDSGAEPYSISRYFIEYWEKGESVITADIGSDLSYSKNFGLGSHIFWRVGVETNNGDINYSQTSEFSIKHTHPLHVKIGGAGAGSSWSDALGDLQEALAVATPGDEIWVAEGVYYPTHDTNREVSFSLKDGVRLYGGFKSTETSLEERNWNINKTILSGNIGDENDDTDNSYHVISSINTTNPENIIDGFIIEKGYANGSVHFNRGGALYIKNGMLTVVNSIFADNYAADYGGAIYNIQSDLYCINSIIKNNRSNYYSGGVYHSSGKTKMINCIVLGNHCYFNNGGIYGYGSGFEISNSIVYKNTSEDNNSYDNRVSASYSLFDYEKYGEGNQNADPLFIDSANGDFRISNNSPCINAGINDSIPNSIEKDFAGNNRVSEDRVDLGIYEGGVIVPVNTLPTNKEIITGSTTGNSISFKANWDSGAEPYSISRYYIEYWEKGESVITADIGSDLSYSKNFNQGSHVFWRVGVETNNGDINYSQTNEFSITHTHPLHVKVGASGTGSSWSDALGDLQDALAVATPGDEIWVAEGTYFPTDDANREVSFSLKDGVKLYGGFKSTETSLEERNWSFNKTILSGNIGDENDNTDNSYHVVSSINTKSLNNLLDGFIIEKGYADYYANNNSDGGGLCIKSGKLTLINLIFRENYAKNDGGAVYIADGVLKCYNSVFTNNSCGDDGGAIHHFSGFSSFVNTVIYKNKSNNAGGGLCSSQSAVNISNSIVYGNEADIAYPNIYWGVINYSIIEGGYSGEGNISANPEFINPNQGDFRISLNSPAINAGINDSIPNSIEKDFAGNNRVSEDRVDIGIYEGGVISPINTLPVNNLIIKSNGVGNNITFKAIWENGTEPYSISRYFIEYWKEGEPVTTVDIGSDLSYSSSFESASRVFWRIGVETTDGFINYSQTSVFSITHNHPLYVKAGASGSGTSWNDAFGKIQDALQVAIFGDEIWVAEGTYYPTEDTDQEISLLLKDGIKLYGGFNGTESKLADRNWYVNKTILSGNIGDKNDETDNSYQVVSCINTTDSITLLDGFIIEKGYGYRSGAGLYLKNANLTVVNSVIKDNYTTLNGGAIYNNSSNLYVINSVLTQNKSDDYAGGVYHQSGKTKLINSVVYGNSAKWTKALYANNSGFEVVNSIVYNNTSEKNSTWDNGVLATYSLFEYEKSGEGNINTEPLFMEPTSGDFRLKNLSPCINTGINDSLPVGVVTDFAGNNRVLDERVDMGIYEGAVTVPINSIPANNSIIKGNELANRIDFKAVWESGSEPYLIKRYFIEYWEEGEAVTSFDISSDLSYSFSFTPGKRILWRVGVETNDGFINYSTTSKFAITHNHPIYVKEGASGLGTSWNDAFGKIQDALSNAIYGDEIWVAQGTYYPTDDADREKSFELKDGMKLYGGFLGTESSLEERNWIVNKTILSGNIGDENDATDNCYRVVLCENTENLITLLDGFIIEKGYGNKVGAGLYLNNAKLTVVNSVFKDNYTQDNGGAICNSSSELYIVNSVVTGNKSGNYAGGIYHYSGKSKVVNCVIQGNHSPYNNGGLYINHSGLDVTNSIIYGNTPNHFVNFNVSYSLIEGYEGGENNISGNPVFLDPKQEDFRLADNSPCINAGVNDSIPEGISIDFAGNNRILDETVDIGVYEGGVVVPIISMPVNKSIIKGDQSGNNITFKAEWKNGTEPYSISRYFIEYWKEGESATSIGIESDLTEVIAIESGSHIYWRIGLETTQGYINYSQINEFFITHSHPLHVKSGSAGSGTSWTDALGSLKEALDIAVQSDEIWVAKGTYCPANDADREKSFELKDGIKLYGGFVGTELTKEERNWRINKTILSGNIGDENDATDNSYQVVSCINTTDSLTLLDGFSIEKGYGDKQGAGLYLSNAKLTVQNSVFKDNYTSKDGGAIFNNSSDLYVVNSVVTENNSRSYGGGIYHYSGKTKVINSVIYGNESSGYNGGLYEYDEGFEVINSIVYGNISGYASSYDSGVSASYSLFEYEKSGDGNIKADPKFLDPKQGDFRLAYNSPCINAGINDSIPEGISTDFAGNNRILEEKVDMGVFEGGIVVPKNTLPLDKSIIKGDQSGNSITFKADWEDGIEPYSGSRYFIEYWKKGEPVTSIDIESDLTKTIAIESGNFIFWRVGIETTDGFINYSQTSKFIISHNHPIHVKTGSTGSGSSWSDAVGNLTEALSIVVPGDEIWVAKGTYYPTDDTDRDVSFELKDGVKLYGGFAGTELSIDERNWRINKTILSGNIGDENDDADNCYNVVSCININDSLNIIDGFVIEKGYGFRDGAGLYLKDSKLTVLNSVFKDNYTSNNGGAIYNSSSVLNVYNSIVCRNKSSNYGGGLLNDSGHLKMVNCVVYGNEAYNSNGGVNDWWGTFEVINSIVYGNIAENNPTSDGGVSASRSLFDYEKSGDGNIKAEPKFIDAANEDFRLNKSSLCINAGINNSIPEDLTKDFAGNHRILEENVDMGVYEGGVIVPVNTLPVNKSIINGNEEGTKITFKAEWDEETEPYAITRYFIEYWMNIESVTTVDISSDLSYSHTFEPGSHVFWRIGLITEDGFINYSPISEFSVKHNHPLYVKSGSSGTGKSWNNAFGDLQGALSKATPGDEIWVAEGIYMPTNGTDREISFNLKDRVRLYGGFKGSETVVEERNWRANKTILSGNIGEENDDTDNSYHVVSCINTTDSLTLLDGFVVEKGYSNLEGGGLYVKKSRMTLVNSVFRNNYSSNYGGAIFNNLSDLYCYNTLIINNKSGDYAGGVYHKSGETKLINCVLYGNQSERSTSALYQSNIGMEVINSIVYGNSLNNYSSNDGGVLASHCLFEYKKDGDNNITADPFFIDPASGDFRINTLSPCLNTGINDSLPKELLIDFAGNQRILDEVVDMGVLEGDVATPVVTYPASGEVIKGFVFGPEVTFKWNWPENQEKPEVEKYILQYWETGEDTISIDVNSSLEKMIALSNATYYNCRVSAIIGNELPVYSPVHSFTITHDHPIYVKEGSTRNGTSWDEAYGDIQDAINIAVRGDEIWVAEGTYYPTDGTNRYVSFKLKEGVKLYGGFSGTESKLEKRNWNIYKTILSGNIGDEDIDTDNSYHVVSCINSKDSLTLIDGFIIEKGYANMNSGHAEIGGGLYMGNSKLTIINSIFRNNYAVNDAGAIYINEGSLNCYNSLFVGNSCGDDGGAIYNYSAFSSFVNCIIYNNTSNYWGGGIYANGLEMYLTNSIVYGNKAEVNYQNINRGTVSYSIIEGGYSGEGVIDTNPLFVDPENGDFRLSKNSPCINSGINDSIPEFVKTDILGVNRVLTKTVDMGAYEAAYPICGKPAHKNAAIPSPFLGLEYEWSIGESADDNSVNNPVAFTSSKFPFDFKVWAINDETKIYEEKEVKSMGSRSLNYDYEQGYMWKVGLKLGDYTYWSDTSIFYIGKDHPIYVKLGATGDGTSWDSAFGSITEALNDAIAGDEIWVAKGTYKPTSGSDKNASFDIPAFVSLLGGFNGDESQYQKGWRNQKENKTILSGDVGTESDNSDNSNHVITIKGTEDEPKEGIIIESFTIEGANSSEFGGAIYSLYGDFNLRNSILKDNKANNGGAIGLKSSSAYIYNSLIHDNDIVEGAVVYSDENSNATIINTTITQNKSGVSGNVTLGNTIVYGNTISEVEGNVKATYSCIEGSYEGEGNVSYDPDFIDADKDDFSLGKFSSCFDKGNDELLPPYKFSDLSFGWQRVTWSSVDIGAYEINYNGRGRIEVESSSPKNDTINVDYAAPIVINFNKPIDILYPDSIQLSPTVTITGLELNEDGTQLTINHADTLVFDQLYTLKIPASSIVFEFNDNIILYDTEISFTIRSCVSGNVVLKTESKEACPIAELIINTETSGDVNSDYIWSLNGLEFTDRNNIDSMYISSVNKDSIGLYTCELTDMCGNVLNGETQIDIKANISTPVIKKKWDDVLYVSNSEGVLSDFKWYLEVMDDYRLNKENQYITISPSSEQNYFATALDKVSGCVVYSDTVKIGEVQGVLKSMTVSPNPIKATEVVNISFGENIESGVIRLYDSKGELIFEDECIETDSYQLDETDLNTGIYLVEVLFDNNRTITKLVITK